MPLLYFTDHSFCMQTVIHLRDSLVTLLRLIRSRVLFLFQLNKLEMNKDIDLLFLVSRETSSQDMDCGTR